MQVMFGHSVETTPSDWSKVEASLDETDLVVELRAIGVPAEQRDQVPTELSFLLLELTAQILVLKSELLHHRVADGANADLAGLTGLRDAVADRIRRALPAVEHE